MLFACLLQAGAVLLGSLGFLSPKTFLVNLQQVGYTTRLIFSGGDQEKPIRRTPGKPISTNVIKCMETYASSHKGVRSMEVRGAHYPLTWGQNTTPLHSVYTIKTT